MSRRQWVLSSNNRDLAAEIAEEFSLDPFVALLLTARGITDSEEIEQFLFEDELFIDPYSITDMDKAVERIRKAVDGKEKIMIFGDYDADGVTSTSLLYLYLKSKGADVGYYIPDRVSEGYGLSCDSVKAFCSQGVRLIITVDNGINAVEETALAKELGLDVVITDHHKVGDVLPDAAAAVNPHRSDCNCEFEDYAGVGVAFKLVCALEGDSYSVLNEYADLAAIGTLADVVPIVSENRVIVRKGIEIINRSSRYGIEALKEYASVSQKKLTSSMVSYALAPRINAAGRMDTARLAMNLLLAEDKASADNAAALMEKANLDRHETEAAVTNSAVDYIEAHDEVKYAPVIVVAGENWHQGVIGIVASRLVARYGKPAIVISTDGETGKGSCRSVDGFSIYDALSEVKDMLTHFGGHTLAAGFGIMTKDIDRLRSALSEYCYLREMPYLKTRIDLNIKPSVITTDLLGMLGMFEPYGAENPQPCFSVKDAVLKGIRPVGEGRHLRLTLSKTGDEFNAMLFSTSLPEFPYALGDRVDIAFRIERNEFRGEVYPSVQISDIRCSDFDFDGCETGMRIYEKFRGGANLSRNEAELLTPDRDFFACVYRFFMSEKTFSFGADMLCHKSGIPYRYAARVLVCLDIMCELGLLKKSNSTYSIVENPGKKDLGSSAILRSLKERG